MKNLLLLLFVFVSVAVNAQIERIEKVVEVSDVDKSTLYGRAKDFFVTTYRSANAVIQNDDVENGKIVGKGTFEVFAVMTEFKVRHSVSIYVKDNKFKYIIEPMLVDVPTKLKQFNPDSYPKAWGGKKKFFEKSNAFIQLLAIDIEKIMSSESKSEEDW